MSICVCCLFHPAIHVLVLDLTVHPPQVLEAVAPCTGRILPPSTAGSMKSPVLWGRRCLVGGRSLCGDLPKKTVPWGDRFWYLPITMVYGSYNYSYWGL